MTTTTTTTAAASASARLLGVALAALLLLPFGVAAVLAAAEPAASTIDAGPPAVAHQTAEEATARSVGCLGCHGGIEPMHASPAVKLACVDCHGGDASAEAPAGAVRGSTEYRTARDRAHVPARFPERWQGSDGEPSARNPENTYTLLLEESPERVRFINPGDLRVSQQVCGPCHQTQVNAVPKSPMTTTAIFWAAAAYANGILPIKGALFGESYGADGKAQRIAPVLPLTDEERARGARPFLLPLPRWEVIQPGEYFRAFERGGILQPSAFPEIGNPNPGEEPGRPDIRFSNRGRGTGLRISPALINLHKTRLNDPHLSLLGTNDHPGDFRSSGCTGCHVVYANDRDPLHSGPWAAYGHRGLSSSSDPTLARDEPGHPIRHRFTRAIPTSQCMTCHMHQPNAFLNTYMGYTMWDYVSDGAALWPAAQRYPTEEEKRQSLEHNPEGAAVRGLWSDREFLARSSELNPTLQQTQLADYHGHGWLFAAVFKRDRQGRLLDREGGLIDFSDPQRFQKAVHLQDIHLERGMHCADCHFSRDSHGDGLLHGEYGNAVEIQCQDCHGTVAARSNLRTSGPAAPPGGTDLSLGTTPFGQQRFTWRTTATGTALFQRSMLDESKEWEVVQVHDTVTPGNARYNERAARAKTVERDGATFGDPAAPAERLAHAASRMACYTCHTAWVTSCFGCHLPQEANAKTVSNHYEGATSRNYASYNPQVVRTDAFMLGKNGDVLGNRIVPVRSSSALVISSTNLNRQRVYVQQPPISAPGFTSQAFNPHVPHTVRTTETRTCSDCHVSDKNDNNAWMAQVLLLGTNTMNFVGRYSWVGLGDDGIEAVAVSEWEEPQAVIGGTLHRLAYPDFFRQHEARRGELREAHHHHGKGEITSLQLRGEYLYTAAGAAGLVVFDVANVDNKDASERIVTAPVSPLGQRTYVRTRDAAAVALPTNDPVAPWRRTSEQYPENREAPMAPIYHYAVVADRVEGLVLVNVDTLSDGDPANNFLAREPLDGKPSFNPDGVLAGARALAIAGDTVYVACDRGLVVVDVATPQKPRLLAVLAEVERPTSVQVQFRYAFVTDRKGLAVVDVTHPGKPRLVTHAGPIADARAVYVARTYAYVAAGAQGLVIVDVERPEHPTIDQVFDAGGALTDTTDVKVAASYATFFAYVADGRNGLRVLELTPPDTVPGYLGFSPRPAPRLVATRRTHGPALALSKGLDRDRAVDESGHQVAVFNRIGARPLDLVEMQRLYLHDGTLYTVSDDPPRGQSPLPPPTRPAPLGLASPLSPRPPASPRAGGATAQPRPMPGDSAHHRSPGRHP